MILCLQRNCPKTQVVKEGDTCEKIAFENGVDLPILRENNQLNDECDIDTKEVRVFYFFFGFSYPIIFFGLL